MDPALIGWIINLVSGAIGGNVAGAVMKDKSLGTLGNSVTGILGGAAGGYILQLLGMAVKEGGLDVASVVSSVASGGVGGAVLMVLAAIVKGMMANKA